MEMAFFLKQERERDGWIDVRVILTEENIERVSLLNACPKLGVVSMGLSYVLFLGSIFSLFSYCI